MTDAVIRRGKLGHTHREDTERMPCADGAEVGVMHLQATECQGVLATIEAARQGRRILPQSLRGGVMLPTP